MPYLKEMGGSPGMMQGVVTLPGSQSVVREEPRSSSDDEDGAGGPMMSGGVLGMLKVLMGGGGGSTEAPGTGETTGEAGGKGAELVVGRRR